MTYAALVCHQQGVLHCAYTGIIKFDAFPDSSMSATD